MNRNLIKVVDAALTWSLLLAVACLVAYGCWWVLDPETYWQRLSTIVIVAFLAAAVLGPAIGGDAKKR